MSLSPEPAGISIDPQRLAAELLRALRGKRSRPAFSRHLGYRSNVVQRWEMRQSWPTAAGFFTACERMRIDTRDRVERFLRYRPVWLERTDLTTPSGVAQLLHELRGKNRIADLARSTGTGRSGVSRWFSGKAQPKLPEFLLLVELCSRRAIDFAVQLFPADALPSIRARWQSLELSRELAYSHPLSHAVLRALELDSYRQPGNSETHFLARRLDLSVSEVEGSLALLQQSAQIKRVRGVWKAQQAVVETGADRGRARALKLKWLREALSRLEGGSPGQFGYSLFAISKKDLRRLAEIQNSYIREMQAVIAASEHSECVALYCTQLLDLASAEENAFQLEPRPAGRS